MRKRYRIHYGNTVTNWIHCLSHNKLSIIIHLLKRRAYQTEFPEMASLTTLSLHNYDVRTGRQGEGHHND